MSQVGGSTQTHWRLLAQEIGTPEPRVLDDGWSLPSIVTMDYPQVLYTPFAATPDQVQILGDHVAMLNLSNGQTTLFATPSNCFGAPMITDARYAIGICTGTPSVTSYFWGPDLATASTFPISVADDTAPGGRDYHYAETLVWIEFQANRWHVFSAPISDLLPSAPRPNPETTSADWNYYNATGHYLAAGFRQFWQHSGGLPVFGFPITEEFTENGLTVQYLERQRFEYHPEFAGTPYETELGLLGSEIATTYSLFDNAPFAAVARSAVSSAPCAPGR